MPLSEMNQRLHVHYYREGITCRPIGEKARLMQMLDQVIA